MKYIGNGFAPSMVKDLSLLVIKEITKEEFEQEAETGYSVIGHPEIAKKFNLALNRETIKLDYGDVLLTVTLARRPEENKVVADGDRYHFDDDESNYAYHMIGVLKPLTEKIK